MPEEKEELVAEQLSYRELYDKHGGSHEEAMFEYCFIHNYFFDSALIKGIVKENSKKETPACLEDELGDLYIAALNDDPEYSGKTFFSQLKR